MVTEFVCPCAECNKTRLVKPEALVTIEELLYSPENYRLLLSGLIVFTNIVESSRFQQSFCQSSRLETDEEEYYYRVHPITINRSDARLLKMALQQVADSVPDDQIGNVHVQLGLLREALGKALCS